MKERLALTLAWLAFINVAFLLFGAALDYLVEFFPALKLILHSEVMDNLIWYYTRPFYLFNFVFGDGGGIVMYFVLSPAIWLGLWLTTGKPRILPWRG